MTIFDSEVLLLFGGGLYLNCSLFNFNSRSGSRSVELTGGSCSGSGSSGRTGAKFRAVVSFGHCECRSNRENNKASNESPSCFLEEAVGLANAHNRTGAAKLRRQATAFRFLDEYNADQQNGNDYGQYNYDNVHSYFSFCRRRPHDLTLRNGAGLLSIFAGNAIGLQSKHFFLEISNLTPI